MTGKERKGEKEGKRKKEGKSREGKGIESVWTGGDGDGKGCERNTATAFACFGPQQARPLPPNPPPNPQSTTYRDFRAFSRFQRRRFSSRESF